MNIVHMLEISCSFSAATLQLTARLHPAKEKKSDSAFSLSDSHLWVDPILVFCVHFINIIVLWFLHS